MDKNSERFKQTIGLVDVRRRESLIIHLRNQLVVYDDSDNERATLLEEALVALTNDPTLCNQPFVVPEPLQKPERAVQEGPVGLKTNDPAPSANTPIPNNRWRIRASRATVRNTDERYM